MYRESFLHRLDEQRGKALVPDSEYIETIRNWLSAIEKRGKKFNTLDFFVLCEELSSLIQQYNHFLCQCLIRLQGVIQEGGWTANRVRQIKQHWNVNRDAHLAFIKSWENIAKRINEQTGSRLCIDYYQPLGTLE